MSNARNLANLLNSSGVLTADAGVKADNITIDGTEIDLSSGSITIDSHTDIILDADSGVWRFKDDGTTLLQFAKDGASMKIFSAVSDADIIFQGNDGGSVVNALTLDMSEGGNVGIGTTSPSHKLSVNGNVGISQGSTLFFVNDSGFSPSISNSGTVTDMSFFTNNSERMRIDINGNVGIGTSGAAAAALHVIGGQLFTNTETSNTSSACHFSNVLTNGAYRIRFDAANVVVGSIQVTTSGTVYNTSSDYRLKENIVTEWDATTRLKQLKPSRFNFKVDKDKTVDGFIAHEVSSIVPEAVSGEKDAVDDDGNIESQLIDQSKLIPLLTKSLQEAVAKIETLEAKVTALESK